jgi:drug/metabolite transporter (DMT)-like permease
VATTKLARVVLWMIGALLSFSVMAVSIRELSRVGLSIFEILAIRSGVALLVLCVLLIVRPGLRVHARPRRMGLNLFRNSVHYASQYAWALSLTMLPLAMVFALEFTMPAWTALLAVWLLHEKMTPSRFGVVVLGLIGVLVILRPGIASFNPATFLVLAAAFGYAITMITTKQLTATETTFGIIFWMAVIQLPLSLIGSDPAVFFHLEPRHILPAIGVGTAGLTSHYCLSNAFRSGDATLVVPLDFMRIPLIAVVGWAFYGERLDIFVLLGALIIVAGVLWNLRAEAARLRLAPP